MQEVNLDKTGSLDNRHHFEQILSGLSKLLYVLLLFVLIGTIVISAIGVVIIQQLTVPTSTVMERVVTLDHRIRELETVTISEWRKRLREENPDIVVPRFD